MIATRLETGTGDRRTTAPVEQMKRDVTIRTAPELLGHAGARFMLDTYTHMIPGSREEAAEVIGRVVFGK